MIVIAGVSCTHIESDRYPYIKSSQHWPVESDFYSKKSHICLKREQTLVSWAKTLEGWRRENKTVAYKSKSIELIINRFLKEEKKVVWAKKCIKTKIRDT